VSLEDRIAPAAAFAEFVDPHPAPGNNFGYRVLPLSTGNVVITAPYDGAGGPEAGAVYLFNGATGALISTLTGSQPFEEIGGAYGVLALANGNFVVPSPNWANGGAANAGAVTFGSGVTGVSGEVGPANSLVGTAANDNVGGNRVLTLTNGNYVVLSPNWSNGTGAATFCSGVTGRTGTVSAANSLVGAAPGDHVGSDGGTSLSDGNYVVNSSNWHNGTAANAGAVTFGSGVSGVSGIVSPANSLAGSAAGDNVGGFGGTVTQLTNGNYVVTSPNWHNGAVANAGAVTFGSGTTGVSGVVSPANSLVGSTANDKVGAFQSVTALSTGNYVVTTSNWANGAAANAGAVTFGSGTTGVGGVISAANSLVGSSADDAVGYGNSGRLTVLANGNYVVSSQQWANTTGAVTLGSGTTGVSGVVGPANSLVGAAPGEYVGNLVTALNNGNYVVTTTGWANSTGAVTFGSGVTGVSGVISAANSLVGAAPGDRVGLSGPTELTNGNFVVSSPYWSNGRGAVTLVNGPSSASGVVSIANSLVGSTPGDSVGYGPVTALLNGNYVVSSPYWFDGTGTQVGAATFVSGTGGVTGAVSADNSLVGSSAGDHVGQNVAVLSNGNYVVDSPNWANGAAAHAGAVTFGNGMTGVNGVISAANSLVGSSANDFIGGRVTALSTGNYVIVSSNWSNGATAHVGAVTFGNGTTGVSGVISATNSLVGSTANDFIGNEGLLALSNGNYVVRSSDWFNGPIFDAGAATFGSGTSGITGVVSAANSLVGSSDYDNVGDIVIPLSNGNYLVQIPYGSSDGPAVTFGSGTSGVTGVVTAANSLVGLGDLFDVVVDNVNATYFAPFVGEGKVRVGSQTTGGQTYLDTTTAVTGSGTPSVVGQSVTFAATVAAVRPGLGQPTGSVTFMDGTTVLGTATLDGSGRATITVTGLSAGPHAITAIYGANANYRASMSSALTQTVLTAQQELGVIITQVTTLVANGVVSSAHGNALIAKLNNAIASLNNGNTIAGVNQLNAFINQADAFVNSGGLDSTDEQTLIDDIDLAIAAALANPF
jgi:hypothetical protein